MRFLLDQNISPKVADLLRAPGRDVTIARDVGLSTATDEVVMAVAAAEQRVLISADTDFGAIPARHPSDWPVVRRVKLANDCVTTVRRRTMWEQTGRRSREVDPAPANRRRPLRAREPLSINGFAAMWNWLIHSDSFGHILATLIAKEELHTLANVETSWPEIEAFIAPGITNAKTEGLNRLITQVKGSGRGFRTVDNQHRRARLHCTRTSRGPVTAASRPWPAHSERPSSQGSGL